MTIKKSTLSRVLALLIIFSLIVPFASASAAVLLVDGNDAGCSDITGTPYCTIQAAIDDAAANDTISVAAGVYEEQLVIDKSLVLQGAGNTTTFIKAPSSMTTDSFSMYGIIRIEGGSGVSVEISDFEIQGPGPTGCASFHYGVFVTDDAYVNLHDNRLIDNRDEPFSGCQNGNAIMVGRNSVSTYGTATIRDNYLEGFQKTGILVDGATSDAVIDGNEVICIGPTDKTAQNGIQVSRGASASIINNEVSGCVYTPASWASTGILLYSAGGIVEVHDNYVHDNMIGLYAQDSSVNSSGNTFDSNWEGVDFYNTTLGLYTAYFNGDQFTNNTNAEWTGAGFWTNDGGQAVIIHSLISGNGIGVENTDDTILDARFNYWGDSSGPSGGELDPVTSDPADGSGDALSAYVRFVYYTGYDPTAEEEEAEVEEAAPVALPDSGFVPGVQTVVSSPAYAATGFTLNIPSIAQSAAIVGVPVQAGEWNVAGLSSEVGYLEGTAFPTWAGNTALTGHVVNSNGLAGPFAQLGELSYGDSIEIQAFGRTYVYSVRSNGLVYPRDLSVLQHSDFDMLTLITCADFNSFSGDYSLRRVVQAVLVDIR